MEQILRYFPDLTDKQKEQFAALDALYRDWNAKINVIYRKDIDNLYEHHVLHSLGFARVIRFRPGSSVLDIGTGGGFPGIPLAILFPEVKFHLLDSIGKKVKVAQAVAEAIGLDAALTAMSWTRRRNMTLWSVALACRWEIWGNLSARTCTTNKKIHSPMA